MAKTSSSTQDNAMAISIENMAHDGRGIGFLQGSSGENIAVFVRGSLPGQTIKCKIINKKKNLWEAELLDIEEDIRPRNVPLCPHLRQCGGCPLQLMQYEEQLKWKENLILQAIRRIGHIDQLALNASWQKAQAAPHLTAYRNKIELAFGCENKNLILGYRAQASHKVFNLESCALVPVSALPIIENCRKLAANLNLQAHQGGLRFLTLRQAYVAGADLPFWHASLLTGPDLRRERKKIAELGERLLAACPQLATFAHEIRTKNDFIAKGEHRGAYITANESCRQLFMKAGEKNFFLGIDSFFQINSEANNILLNKIHELDKNLSGPLLDLYCGVGAPGQLLAENHEECLGMEIDKNAIAYARQNAACIEKWRYLTANIDNLATNIDCHSNHWQTVLLDPPRAGITKEALNALMGMAPKHVIYISCNPATLARDAAILQTNYKLKQLGGIDMFPHTPHIECYSLWERIKHPTTN